MAGWVWGNGKGIWTIDAPHHMSARHAQLVPKLTFAAPVHPVVLARLPVRCWSWLRAALRSWVVLGFVVWPVSDLMQLCSRLFRSVVGSRAAVVMGVGAVAVHELRYFVAYDGDAARLVSHEGHPYLAVLSPGVALLLVWLLARSLSAARSSWMAVSGGLLGVYVGQALVEGVLAPGQLTGAAGLVGHGGWIVLPLVVVAGWLVARVGRVLHERLARLGPRLGPCSAVSPAAPTGAAVQGCVVRKAVLACKLAGRAPPAPGGQLRLFLR